MKTYFVAYAFQGGLSNAPGVGNATFNSDHPLSLQDIRTAEQEIRTASRPALTWVNVTFVCELPGGAN
jgi:hypothetical protein